MCCTGETRVPRVCCCAGPGCQPAAGFCGADHHGGRHGVQHARAGLICMSSAPAQPCLVRAPACGMSDRLAVWRICCRIWLRLRSWQARRAPDPNFVSLPAGTQGSELVAFTCFAGSAASKRPAARRPCAEELARAIMLPAATALTVNDATACSLMGASSRCRRRPSP